MEGEDRTLERDDESAVVIALERRKEPERPGRPRRIETGKARLVVAEDRARGIAAEAKLEICEAHRKRRDAPVGDVGLGGTRKRGDEPAGPHENTHPHALSPQPRNIKSLSHKVKNPWVPQSPDIAHGFSSKYKRQPMPDPKKRPGGQTQSREAAHAIEGDRARARSVMV